MNQEVDLWYVGSNEVEYEQQQQQQQQQQLVIVNHVILGNLICRFGKCTCIFHIQRLSLMGQCYTKLKETIMGHRNDT